MVAAPTCGAILADLGADVIKVESPNGDLTREFGPRMADGSSAMYSAINRSKRNTISDLRDGREAERLAVLLDNADVLITNLDSRVLEAAGLDPATATINRPNLVYLRIRAFADENRPGTDSLAQAWTGMTEATGYPDRGGVRVGPPVVDVSSGICGALAVLAALEDRRQTGEGQVITVTLEDVSLYLQQTNIAMAARDPSVVARRVNESPIVCTPVLDTASSRIFLSIVGDKHWRLLCEEVGRSDLINDVRFASGSDRRDRQSAIEAALAQTFLEISAHEWSERLSARGIPHSVERNYTDLLSDQALRSRGAVFELGASTSAASVQVALPMRFSRWTAAAASVPPPLADSADREIGWREEPERQTPSTLVSTES